MGTICNVGYTGDDCSQCAPGFIQYEDGCTRYPDTYCSVAGSIGKNIDNTCECKVRIGGFVGSYAKNTTIYYLLSLFAFK